VFWCVFVWGVVCGVGGGGGGGVLPFFTKKCQFTSNGSNEAGNSRRKHNRGKRGEHILASLSGELYP